jgi:hypothetical protein
MVHEIANTRSVLGQSDSEYGQRPNVGLIFGDWQRGPLGRWPNARG